MGQKAVFLDRDDTLIQDPGYIRDPDQVKLMTGAAHALWQLKKMGYMVIVVTNQSGIARGLVTPEQLEEVHRRMCDLLASEGVYLDGIYHCPYHPDGTVAPYNCDSDLRKPKPGMLLLAARDKEIDLANSWMIGDSYRDIKAGQAAGCHTILVDVPGKPRVKQADEPEPERKAVNLREAVNIVRMYEFHQKVQKVKSAVYEKREGAAMTEKHADKTPATTEPQNLTPPKKEAKKQDIAEKDSTASDASTPSRPSAGLPLVKGESMSDASKETSAKDIPCDAKPASRPSAGLPPVKGESLTEATSEVERPTADHSEPGTNTPSPAARVLPLVKGESLSQGETEPTVSKARTFKRAAEPEEQPVEQTGDRTTQLLEEILQQLKHSGRDGLYQDFSVFKLIAMLLQMLAIFCLVASIGYWLSAAAGFERVFLMLGYSIALQLLVIALMMMHHD